MDAQPVTAEALAARTKIPLEPLKALLPMMSALGFLVPRRGHYQLTNAARLYLLHESPTYWATLLL